MIRNIALVISYDGTDFSGWQVQNRDRSVQGTIENALGELHGEPVSLTGAGRTDAGVHATGQVANFRSAKPNIAANRYRDALNAHLPRDIRILRSLQAPEGFHARRNAISRHYEYHIVQGPAAPAHLARFAWMVRRLPPLGLLNDMAQTICGTHDFTTFAAAGDSSACRIRRIDHALFLTHGSSIQFRIKGSAFLWRMVRSLLGTMIDLGTRGGDTGQFRRRLEARDRREAGPTAPPRGLFLTKVDYGSDAGIR